MFTSLDAPGLVNCLECVPPAYLQAVSLLGNMQRAAAAGEPLPTVSQDALTVATSELIAYTKACAGLANQLQHLAPVILKDLECPAWPL